MATDNTIQDHHVLMFTKNVELLLQQKQPLLAGKVKQVAVHGEGAQAVLQYGQVDMVPFGAGTADGQWYGNTVFGAIDHDQRWMFPSDFSLALPLSDQNEIRMITNPLSSYAEAMRASYARRYDDTIISAFNGSATTGKYDSMTQTAFPAAQVVAAGTDGLTKAKLLAARKMMLEAQVDPSETRYFACSEAQITDLLNDPEVVSADYNTVRALVQGEIDTWLGFKFVSTERLPEATSGTRNCFAWVPSGIQLGIWKPMSIKSDVRPDKNYIRQLWMSATLGAVRTQDAKVVQVDCVEA
jgi:hypothetical protein